MTAEAQSVQAALNFLGYAAGPVDGVIGARSRAAIAAYQQSVGQAPTGRLNETQQAAATAAPVPTLVPVPFPAEPEHSGDVETTDEEPAGQP